MRYKRAVVVLIGQETASRQWVIYEIEKAWREKKPLVGVRIHGLSSFGSADRQGANPFDQADGPSGVPVFGWHVASSHEPQVAGHERVVVDATVLAPPGFKPGSKDFVVLPIGEFETVGDPEDFNHGPFGMRAGNQINLRRVTG